MMQALKTIVDFFASLYDVMNLMLKSLFSLIKLIVELPTYNNEIIATFPPFLVAFALTSLALTFVMMILGRNR